MNISELLKIPHDEAKKSKFANLQKIALIRYNRFLHTGNFYLCANEDNLDEFFVIKQTMTLALNALTCEKYSLYEVYDSEIEKFFALYYTETYHNNLTEIESHLLVLQPKVVATKETKG